MAYERLINGFPFQNGKERFHTKGHKLTNFTFHLISPQVFTAVCKAIPHLKEE